MVRPSNHVFLYQIDLHEPNRPVPPVEVGRFPFVLGRAPDSDLAIKDQFISSRHCVIDRVNGVLLIQDLQSFSGTVLNGRKVTAAPLRPGDWIQVGEKRVLITMDH